MNEVRLWRRAVQSVASGPSPSSLTSRELEREAHPGAEIVCPVSWTGQHRRISGAARSHRGILDIEPAGGGAVRRATRDSLFHREVTAAWRRTATLAIDGMDRAGARRGF